MRIETRKPLCRILKEQHRQLFRSTSVHFSHIQRNHQKFHVSERYSMTNRGLSNTEDYFPSYLVHLCVFKCYNSIVFDENKFEQQIENKVQVIIAYFT